ncbi:pyruvate dehydrogenase E1 component, alpha subunit [Schinkia azotoformans MEV2011]|uniref:Pyruvate dehydrogenase E1 component subunit alpha n=1 Tax=Schinkia azotoformans MEV2011 TaxID=1348973 RepID=A0A072NJ05_SCHAZ|nr:pyruvate dehydrogenase (acetyl-transferring) E1 component subunit alpha [Schinkia azotoformans]KEF37664.1 pyruvate dehydrogenase E1 component, alpha subunit [Schinkia azotoformans MEV2011]MEC1697952.1 pyruvate dehydrogenase (acetyl-transferring) E1 component subunit alpha [Schinkia azotoformans]MEC1717113.1 pyruvate dehydrogenase (acetyl-transferring) E1 component subunit alpha [Schinkia azotoformans]MEC1725180.1 pyruvate dehydrogenase (acetyl-transferring) E1 component subunit alpha [Schink
MELDIDFYQVLTENGEIRESIEGKIDQSLMLRMYVKMLLVRLLDRKCVNLQRQGRLGTYAPFEGQEASQVGSALALSPRDWLFPTYRDHAAALVHGQSLYRIFLYWAGHVDGTICPDKKRILPPSVPIATHMLHAVGTAWASKLKGEKNCSIAYFGDGATSEGDFHEALNFAGVYKTPTIFFCQNNGYAISLPFEKQSASRTIAQRAIAYDIKGIRVDGNDIFAVYITVKEAIERALRGDGPTLIEAITFRYGAHTTADDPQKYRDQEALSKEWKEKRDPLLRLQKFLLQKDIWSQALEEQWQLQINEDIKYAFEKAVNYPKTTPLEMFNHVYADKPWNIKEQQDELHSFLQKDVN